MADDDFEIVWEDPPPQLRGKYADWTGRFIEALRANPGKWGKMPQFEGEDFPASVLTALRKHKDIQAVGRASADRNRIRIYGQCVESDPEALARRTLKSVGK